MTAPDLEIATVVARPPDVVYQAIADPVRIAAYSPEASGVAEEPGTPPGPLPVGARFRGSNRNGLFRWSTQCTGVADRRSHNERTMRATLDALRTDLEGS